VRLLVLLAVCLPAAAGELFLNGGFELPLDSGWTIDSGGHARATFSRDTGLQPDPDYEARTHLGPADGYASLTQTVPVPGPRLTFKADLCLYAHFTEPTNWAAAGCRITYLDSARAPLGETRIYVATARCPWQSSSTLHLIPAADSFWHSYELDIAAELLDNLPGVDTSLVRFISVGLKDTSGAS